MKVINKVNVRDSEENYMRDWLKVSRTLEDNGMTWSAGMELTEESNFTEEEWCQYVTLSMIKLNKDVYQDTVKATEELRDLLNDVVDNYYRLPLDVKNKVLDDVGFSDFDKKIILGSKREEMFSYFCRFDLVLDEKTGKHKCIEFNSDTPTGLLETGMAHSVLNDYYEEPVFNSVESSLVKVWDRIRETYQVGEDTIYFSSLDDNIEDKMTVEYNRLHSEHTGKSKFVALEDISVTKEGLYDTEGNLIKYWFRLYPLEYWEDEIIIEQNNEGKDEEVHLGEILSKLVIEGKVEIINPVSAFLVQNKNFYRLIYSQLKDNQLRLSRESLKTIENRLLATYKTKEEIEYIKDYVEKPVYGREGNCVTIYKDNKIFFEDVVHEDTEYYGSQDMIYQEYIELPKVKVETWDGEYEGSLLTGSYLIGGEPCGLYLRVGHMVTGNLSLFCTYTLED